MVPTLSSRKSFVRQCVSHVVLVCRYFCFSANRNLYCMFYLLWRVMRKVTCCRRRRVQVQEKVKAWWFGRGDSSCWSFCFRLHCKQLRLSHNHTYNFYRLESRRPKKSQLILSFFCQGLRLRSLPFELN